METVTKPANKRDRAKALTRQKTIDTARSLWAQPGSYTTGTMRDIAKHMGMSTGAIFANFTGKDELWREAFGTEPPTDSVLTRQALAFYAEHHK